MSVLIVKLRNEHASIVNIFGKIKGLGITSKEGRDELRLVKNALLAHLKAEDEQLYPILKEEARKNSALKSTLDMFASDADTVTKEALRFFDKYSVGGSGIEFAEDFGRLYALLSSRISKEENILYPEYDKLDQ